MNRLRITLYVQAVYLTVLGILFLFLPGVAQAAFGTTLPDHALTPIYGQVLLVLAALAFLVASGLPETLRVVWGFIFEQLGHVLVFGYLLMTGIQSFAQVGPPLIIAAIFLVLLLVFQSQAKA